VKIWEILNIVLSTLVSGMFWGPWLALTRSLDTFDAEVFLAIVHRMTPNMASVMTVLMPTALLSAVPVLLVSYDERPKTFYLTLAGTALFIVALLVSVLIELPIVNRFGTWTALTLPDDWQRLRDRWGSFHVVRIAASLTGLVLLLVAAIF
jgi:hypothetical protein